MVVEEAVQIGAVAQGDDQARLARMVVAQVVKLADVLLALAPDGSGGDREQLVGGLPHGGNYDHGPTRFAGAHDAGNTLDGSGGLHGAAAELHDDHQSSIPSECISSAFSTAAPAAPRMVLWLSTTNLKSSTGQGRRRPTNAAMPRSRSASLRGCGRLL